MASKKTHADALTEIRSLEKKLEKHKAKARERLQSELADADAHAKSLRDALAKLDGTPAAAPTKKLATVTPIRARSGGTLANKSMPDAILAAIAALGPSSVGAIITWIEAHGKKVNRKNFGSDIFKMKKAGRITARGKKGAMRYGLGK